MIKAKYYSNKKRKFIFKRYFTLTTFNRAKKGLWNKKKIELVRISKGYRSKSKRY